MKCVRCGKEGRYKGTTLCSKCYKRAKSTTHIKIKPPFKFK